jgi:hypothetical protein
MQALVALSTRAVSALAWQSPNTDAQWEILNAYQDGRLIVVVIAAALLFMLVRGFKGK